MQSNNFITIDSGVTDTATVETLKPLSFEEFMSNKVVGARLIICSRARTDEVKE